jgi:hypothetical protein
VLGYVFWHWPEDRAAAAAYEAAQRRFHQALAASRSEGFIRSLSFRVSGASWLPAAGEVYEDWYLVEGSFALDPLNDLAISPAVRADHAEAARGAKGAGALYRLVLGVPAWESGEVSWVSKPRGEAYDAFYRRLPEAAVLWRRQMVLGPASEFLLEAAPPPGVDAVRVRRELAFST